MAARQGREDIGFTEGLVITALLYLVAALVGAVPFLSVVGFADAFFESMSGFTTTGLTLVPLTDLPRSLLFFRAFSQWIGGAGIVVLTLVLLLRTTKPAHRLYVSEAGEGEILGSVRTTAAAVAKVYLVLTGAAILLFFGSGMDTFDAVLHALATVSTGGFSPYADSLGHFPQRSVRLAVIFFMLVGATSSLSSTGPEEREFAASSGTPRSGPSWVAWGPWGGSSGSPEVNRGLFPRSFTP
jgi:trk system potassium uptake protein TrkH